MRLLSPTQNKDLKEQETLRQILRAQELNKETKLLRENLAKADAEFAASLKRKNEIWQKEELELNKKKRELEHKIASLETREAYLRLPIEQLEAQAKFHMEQAKDKEKEVKEREEANELIAEELQDKLDKVGQKEQDLKVRNSKLDNREMGIEAQKTQTIEGIRKLNEEMAKFEDYKEKEEKKIDERKTALVLWDRSLQAEREKIKRTNEAFDKLAKKLASDREALQSGFDELKRLSTKAKGN